MNVHTRNEKINEQSEKYFPFYFILEWFFAKYNKY